MKEKQWVCHISGQGEKWEVSEWDNKCWITEQGTGMHSDKYFLPKSEYRLCEPPEVWRDVTGECELLRVGYTGEWTTLVHRHANSVQEIIIGSPNHIVSGYRLRKVHLWTQDDGRKWAFIVEQEVTQ
jgi:hypothetical protein